MHYTQVLLVTILFTTFSCIDSNQSPGNASSASSVVPARLKEIKLPEGYQFLYTGDSVYASWLLNLELKKTNTVYLYNKQRKKYQGAQFAVLDLDIGKKDLLQCADAAIKLRADFLFMNSQFDKLSFVATSGDKLSFQKWLQGTRWKEKGNRLQTYESGITATDRNISYRQFMDLVYTYCGTYSLSRQLKAIDDNNDLQPGDIFIEGGFPGHAVTVMAVAKNTIGKKIILLSQGYMPAQDIHLLKNFNDSDLNPWYSIEELYPLNTPQWKFGSRSLKRWQVL